MREMDEVDYAVTAFHCQPYFAPGTTCWEPVLAHAYQRFERCPRCGQRFRLTWASDRPADYIGMLPRLVKVERQIGGVFTLVFGS